MCKKKQERPTGWLGDESVLLEVLKSLKAERDENGDVKTYGHPVVKGVDGSVTVHQLTEIVVEGERKRLAPLLLARKSGVAVVVF